MDAKPYYVVIFIDGEPVQAIAPRGEFGAFLDGVEACAALFGHVGVEVILEEFLEVGDVHNLTAGQIFQAKQLIGSLKYDAVNT